MILLNANRKRVVGAVLPQPVLHGSNYATAKNSVNVSVPSGAVIGDLLVYIAIGMNFSARTISIGNFTTIIARNDDTPLTMAYRIVDGTETTTYNASMTSSGAEGINGYLFLIKGASSTDPIEGFSDTRLANSSSSFNLAGVAGNVNDLHVGGSAVYEQYSSGGSISGTGWSPISSKYASNDIQGYAAKNESTGPDAYGMTISNPNRKKCAAGMVRIKA